MAQRAKIRPKVLFLHIGWARQYRGAFDDLPVGTFGYMRKGNRDVGEALNFKVYDGHCYGYAPRTVVNIRRLGAAKGVEHVDGVLVIWTATDPAQGGRYIVGWYRNARVFAKLQRNRPDMERPEMLVDAAAADCHLVPIDERAFHVPNHLSGWPGIASTFFATEMLSTENVRTVLDYVDGSPSSGFPTPGTKRKSPPPGKGWPTQDPTLRAKVEEAAIGVTLSYYRELGWAVTSVEAENYGWDLEARISGRLLRIEVKGRGSVVGGVEITSNEYNAMHGRTTRMSYRLAIVHGALTKTPKLVIFEFAPASNSWVGPGGLPLALILRTGATATF